MVLYAKAAGKRDALKDGDGAFAFKFKHVFALSAPEVMMVGAPGWLVTRWVFR